MKYIAHKTFGSVPPNPDAMRVLMYLVRRDDTEGVEFAIAPNTQNIPFRTGHDALVNIRAESYGATYAALFYFGRPLMMIDCYVDDHAYEHHPSNTSDMVILINFMAKVLEPARPMMNWFDV